MLRQSGLFTLCLIFCFCCFCIGCAINPITGEEDLMFYPEGKDIAIGKKYAPEVEKQLDGKIGNQDLQDYVDRIGQKIARVSQRPDLEYHFVALRDKSTNAIALPGGYVFVLRGMLEKLTSESQLAALLGHEIAHVVARDSMAALSRQRAVDVLMVAAIAGRAPDEAVRAAGMTRLFLDLRYSREDERQADLAGLAYMTAAGYDPHGAVELIQILEDEHAVKQIEFFSTHPSPRNRRQYLTQEIENKYSGLAGLKTGSRDYHSNVLQPLTGAAPSEVEGSVSDAPVECFRLLRPNRTAAAPISTPGKEPPCLAAVSGLLLGGCAGCAGLSLSFCLAILAVGASVAEIAGHYSIKEQFAAALALHGPKKTFLAALLTD
ncbi:MAG: M48 family metallopeptidase [Sedimentisphaerales bacterium]|nr:M48 family metallopeptidase [Sedimentisphaerales bacterium]